MIGSKYFDPLIDTRLFFDKFVKWKVRVNMKNGTFSLIMI